MHSGIEAAESVYNAIKDNRFGDLLSDYNLKLKTEAVGKDLKKVRNVAPLNARFGPLGGLILGGFDMWFQTLFSFSLFGTLKHEKSDAASTESAAKHKEIKYPKPDGSISFDRLTNVSFSMTNHEENQPCHLQLNNPLKLSTYHIICGLSYMIHHVEYHCGSCGFSMRTGDDHTRHGFTNFLKKYRVRENGQLQFLCARQFWIILPCMHA